MVASKRILEGDLHTRKIFVTLFSCAVLSAALVANSPSEASARTVSGEAAVAEAQSYIGTPYGAGGLDCSGFTSAVYADLGVSSEAVAGDLVFFDAAGYGISHVGIATGYGTMIHSSTYFGEITESSIYDVPGYVGAVDVS